MTLVQMYYFQAVCRYENFTKAANALHMSQPALSATMKDLEKECGVPLFLKDKNTLHITEEGHILEEEINLLLKRYEQLDYVKKELLLKRNYLRIGLSTLSGNQVYPMLKYRFSQKYPDIEVISTESFTQKLFESLDIGQLDLVITIHRLDTAELQSQYNHWLLAETTQVLCVGKNTPLSEKNYVSLEEISKVPLILLNDDFGQTKRIKSMFEDNGLSYKVMHYTSQMYSVERFVEQGVAVGFLPKVVVDKNPDIVGIPYEGTVTHAIELFWKKNVFHYPAVRAFIETAKELYPKKRIS